MKKVVPASQVAHLWANKIQSDARVAAGNFYFDGDTIYSYGKHFPIATHRTVKGQDVILFTLDTYSNTTAKHIWEVRSAITHLKDRIVYCYDIPLNNDSTHVHEKNIAQWIQNIAEHMDKMSRARIKENYLTKINQEKGYIDRYLEFFKVKMTRDQKKTYNLSDTSEILEAVKAAREKEKAAWDKVKKIGQPVLDAREQMWREYNDNRTYAIEKFGLPAVNAADQIHRKNKSSYDGATILRTNGTEVQTSKGVKIPVAIAERYYDKYLAVVRMGGCNNTCNYKMMGYDVKEMNKDMLVVGCHNIPRTEIDYIANKLNW